ncbi:hypothetical protein [Streptomyces bauhiniae]|uniref:Uncharacterized protein n=1 Tax=Streptomyces bauhiniae TaxID=2340725 RepID=A0A7K3QYX5_9ACTN|nr:hypothetical protein [Streptomyces bauhiniae]NEB95098.1 hypothetical protein [Streptomyces bauhiniae]
MTTASVKPVKGELPPGLSAWLDARHGPGAFTGDFLSGTYSELAVLALGA